MAIKNRQKTTLTRQARFLITAGPTWVEIDEVRIISNKASGETGIRLARALAHNQAKVTLLLGPVSVVPRLHKVKVVRFKFFDELRRHVRKELKGCAFDAIVHSAAVSDFAPKKINGKKLPSDKTLRLTLHPLPKILDDIGKLRGEAKVIMFKQEAGVSDRALVARARRSRAYADADIVVANRLMPYKAFLIDATRIIATAKSKNRLIITLTNLLKKL